MITNIKVNIKNTVYIIGVIIIGGYGIYRLY